MRRDLIYLKTPAVLHPILNIKGIDRELIMLQQMCKMLGKRYSISLAVQYLKKLDIKRLPLKAILFKLSLNTYHI